MKVRITIRGRTYTVASDEDDVDVEDVARLVDARMAEVGRGAPGLDEYTIAMLAALNLGSDLRRLQQLVADELEDLEREVVAAAVVMDAALPPDGGDEG